MQNTSVDRGNVNVAVVGVGYWGRNLARVFHELGALTVLCDASQSIETTCARQYDGVRFCRQFTDVLADPSVHAVALATPAVMPYKMGRATLEPGIAPLVGNHLRITVKH